MSTTYCSEQIAPIDFEDRRLAHEGFGPEIPLTEAPKATGVSYTWLWICQTRGLLKTYKVGRRLVVERREIARFNVTPR